MFAHLSAYASAETVVTVKKTDGKTYTGRLVQVGPAEPKTFSVRTGRSGRPAKVHADDVETVEAVPAIES